ncbi:DUF4258 domain-containing protein [Gammaproteobacteria bacterium]|nr:DUF4258 domain-containing protein [Gammaproteobacteria bacterium]
MDILFTQHSKKRMQQRGISENTIKYLIEYGECKFDGHGGKIFYLNKKNRNFIPSCFNKNQFTQIRKQLNSYVVLSNEDQVITVGHRYKRRKN